MLAMLVMLAALGQPGRPGDAGGAWVERDVVIRVMDEARKPMPGVYLGGVTMAGRWAGRADVEGVVRVRVRTGAEEAALLVGLTPTVPELEGMPRLGDKELKEAVKIQHDALTSHAWQARASVSFEKGAERVVGEFAASPGYTVHGRIVDHAGKPSGGGLVKGGVPGLLQAGRKDGVFQFTAAVGAAPFAYATSGDGTGYRFDWEAAKAGETREVGDVKIPEAGARRCVSVECTSRGVADARFDEGWAEGVTLISADGRLARGCSWGLGEAAKCGCEGGPLRMLQVPPGTYYAVPGWFIGTRCQFKVAESLRAGEDVEKKWGTPKVVVEEGKDAAVRIDEERLYKAVMGELPPKVDGKRSAIVVKEPAGR